MLTHYYTVKENGQSEIEIKKSRFICQLYRVTDESEAKEIIQKVKKEHWKANHNCSAFLIGDQNQIQRSSDDGEPSGTAGIPMLEVLKKRELINVLAIVTRYFGGTKLGAGGLIRAYGNAVSHALDEIGIVEGKLQQEISVKIEYPLLGKLQNFIETTDFSIKEILYTDVVEVLCMVDEELGAQFEAEVINILNNQCAVEHRDSSYFETPFIR